MAGDSFFAKERKRKRPAESSRASGSSKPTKPYEKPFRPAMYGKGANGAKAGRRRQDEEVTDEDDGGDDDLAGLDMSRNTVHYDSDGEEADRMESAAAKRVRLAKSYLDKVKGDLAVDDGSYDAAEIDRELIASRLQQDVDEVTGKIHLFLASSLSPTPERTFVKAYRGQHLTSACVSFSDLYTSSKEGQIARYSLRDLHLVGRAFGQDSAKRDEGKKKVAPQTNGKAKGKGKENAKAIEVVAPAGGHKGEILCLAASEDGRYLLSGGRDKAIGVWEVGGKGVEAGSVRWLKALGGHKDAVTSIAVPPLSNPSHHILAASLSRHLTLHSIATLSLIDTFFGHQDAITSVSALKPTAAVTSGGRDRTGRWWRVEEEVQLVFRGGGKTVYREQASEEASGDAMDVDGAVKKVDKGKGKDFVEGSLDVVCMLDDQHFLSGGDSGSICLWNTGKKKPIFTHGLAHGVEDKVSESEGLMSGARWITSIAALRGTDLFASGSWDGSIRLWRLASTLKSFSPLFTIPAAGFVNSLQLVAIPPGVLKAGKSTGDKPAAARSTAKPQPEMLLVAALSKEPRLGRWSRVTGHGTHNGTLICKLQAKQDVVATSEDAVLE